MNKKYLQFFLSVAIYVCSHVTASACSHDTAFINESLKTFITYPFSDPDPIPSPESNYYPYFKYGGFTQQATNKDWKVVIMENNYIKVFIFSEIGGKVWGAIEKSTGREFIYYNSVVKFRNIAMRGPWTSGGIEFNFGIIGHTPTTANPVDYLTKTNKDGSVSCIIGATEFLTRTRWEVENELLSSKLRSILGITFYSQQAAGN